MPTLAPTPGGRRIANKLERSLGLVDLTAIVMGAIIGVGIFFAPANVMNVTGSAGTAVTTWVAGALIALIGALTFAELGALLPRTGGQYLVLRATYGRPVAFLYCWSLLCVIQSGAIAIIGVLCAQYLAGVFDLELTPVAVRVVACGIILGLTVANIVGVRQGAAIANLTTIVKAVLLLAIVAVGVLGEAREAVPATVSPEGDGSFWLVLPGLVFVLFSFGGWQQGTYLAGEVKRPGRNLPLGIIGGVSIVGVLYVAVNAGLVTLLTPSQMVSSPMLASDAVGAVFPSFGRRAVSAGVAVSAFGVASVCIMTAPRMYKAIADDGCFFPAIGRVHPRLKTPALAVGVQGAIALAMAGSLGIEALDYMTTGVVCIDWVFFLLTGISLFVLRKRMPDAERPYRAWGYPILPGLFVVAAAAVVVATFLREKTRGASLVAVAVLASGVLAYAAFNRGRRSGAAPPEARSGSTR